MGTRSLTTFIEKWKVQNTQKTKTVKIVTMYRQYDGFPTSHGMELAEFLRRGKLVNGINLADEGVIFNGMGCLAAQCIAHFKDGPGNFYLHRGGEKDCGEEYRYEVIFNNDNKTLTLKCIDVYGGKCLFEGNPKDFVTKFKEKEEVES